MQKKDLDVVIERGFVTIKGERKKRHVEDTWNTHRVERSHGKVSRTVQLPWDADWEHSDAKFENGVLQVDFPKTTTTSATHKKLTIA
mgnify:CR=1 FL=1